jgi:uncharacterized membrane protein YuzA (DUF378 family)
MMERPTLLQAGAILFAALAALAAIAYPLVGVALGTIGFLYLANCQRIAAREQAASGVRSDG